MMSHLQIVEVIRNTSDVDVRPDNVKISMERLRDKGVISFTAMK